MDVDAELAAAIERYNRVRIAEVETESGLRWLGEQAPIYRLGTVAVRGLLLGRDGRYWGDVGLVVESGWPPGDLRDWCWEQFTFGDVTTYETLLMSPARGRVNALFVALDDIAAVLDLEPPQRSTDGWARGWGCQPDISDDLERGLIAHGAGVIAGRLW
ncbi:hypothetical protein RB614_40450 [Phytohabitans sp. ZYX-F-186]|uniref:Uncharacterized protein n=1 Tax=Phytohabitans maris TaxID=3071409 RepID=A0ABU0ZUR6_9ACTN|nr:hypothetical protein [Phytohabitans sp. ZYX-F-186]MDQ7910781.1 hypothetical protein [Phytohabitans sp. ZYX-F-186]